MNIDRLNSSLCRVVLSVALILCCGCATTSSKLVGQQAPLTRFYMLDGEVTDLDQFLGQNVVLLFWATTCTYSHNVVERLNAFAAKEGQAKNFTVIAISIDKSDNLEKLRERIKYYHLNSMLHAFSGNEYYDEAYIAFDLDSLPFLFVIGPDGNVKAAGVDDDVVYDNL